MLTGPTPNSTAHVGQLADIFTGLPQKSVKWSSYFRVYDEILHRLRGRDSLVVVEIGVLDGGSLLMWRAYFGESARIIGVDVSSTAERMRAQGFEVYIGDQSDPDFWQRFFAEVGSVDVIIDDGGHTNRQQIVTVECCLDHVRDGGWIIVEDVHTSYMQKYGNPSAYSFVNYAKNIVDRIQARSPSVAGMSADRFASSVHGVSMYESLVCFHVDRRLCAQAELVEAGEAHIGAENHWLVDKRLLSIDRAKKLRRILQKLGLYTTVAPIFHRTQRLATRLRLRLENQGLRRYFR